jgi:hypothetical protein
VEKPQILKDPEYLMVNDITGCYWQKGGHKECCTCHRNWMADIDYCPYCHISQELRIRQIQPCQTKKYDYKEREE